MKNIVNYDQFYLQFTTVYQLFILIYCTNQLKLKKNIQSLRLKR